MYCNIEKEEMRVKRIEKVDKNCRRNKMFPVYEQKKENVHILQKTSRHAPPHLHNSVEFIYVISGSMEIGMGQELFHMDEGDFAVIFPDVIHHYQVFSEKTSRADYILVPSSFAGVFKDKIQGYAPKYPVIRAGQIEPDVYNAIQAIIQMEENEPMIVQAYVQIVLARCIGKMELVEKSCVGSDDLIYRTVSYVSGNFRKKFSLEEMAHDLGVSKYVLSRVFSKTFHRNFNQYLNDARLSYACTRLVNSGDTILDICLDSGFDSQRTFNRAFKERYRITPSEYRKLKR